MKLESEYLNQTIRIISALRYAELAQRLAKVRAEIAKLEKEIRKTKKGRKLKELRKAEQDPEGKMNRLKDDIDEVNDALVQKHQQQIDALFRQNDALVQKHQQNNALAQQIDALVRQNEAFR